MKSDCEAFWEKQERGRQFAGRVARYFLLILMLAWGIYSANGMWRRRKPPIEPAPLRRTEFSFSDEDCIRFESDTGTTTHPIIFTAAGTSHSIMLISDEGGIDISSTGAANRDNITIDE